MALFAELLSVPTLGRWPTLDLSPQRDGSGCCRRWSAGCGRLLPDNPVLVVVEDAHWVDPTTRELLDLLVAEAPIDGAAACRHPPTRSSTQVPGSASPKSPRSSSTALAPAEHRALLRRVAGKPLPAEVEAEILAHTDGVPLFVEEVTRAVLESGLLREEAGRWVLDGALPRLAVPPSLQASLVARLDRLSSAREVAQAGAVIGREFAYDLLAAVAGLAGAGAARRHWTRSRGDLIQRRASRPMRSTRSSTR